MDPEALTTMTSNPNDNRGPLVAGVVGAFFALIYLSMALRVYVRRKIQGQWGWDDNLMVGATVCFSALSGVIFWGVNQGMGRHVLDLKPWAITRSILAWYICEILYSFCITLVKVSISIFLLRIAVNRIHRVVILCTTAANLALGIVFLGFMVFQCTPISYFWLRGLSDPSIHGHCTNTIGPFKLVYAYSAFNVAIDLTYAILPAFMVWDLQMPRRTKVLIAAILGMGTMGSMALLIRIPYVARLGENPDFLYDTTNVAIWSVVELGMGIVAGSLATLRPLLLAVQANRRRNGPAVPELSSELRRPYFSHLRRHGSDERVLGASGSACMRDTATPGSGEGDVSLEKLDLEGRGRLEVGSLSRLSASGRTVRWSVPPFPEAPGRGGEEDEEKDVGMQNGDDKSVTDVEVRIVIRQSSIDAPVVRSSLDSIVTTKDAGTL